MGKPPKNNRLFKNLLSGEIIFDYNTTIFNNCQSVFENLIRYVFGASDHLASVGQDESDEKELLRSALLSVTHKLYLDAYLRLLRQDAERAQKETEKAQ